MSMFGRHSGFGANASGCLKVWGVHWFWSAVHLLFGLFRAGFRVAEGRCQASLVVGVAFAMWSRSLYGAGDSLPQYASRLWQMEDGLPHTVVQAITQTRDGFLWVGTREGLARFDGVQFKKIDLETGLVQPSVVCLAEDREGSLWVGTEDAGLFRLRGGKVTRVGRAEGLQETIISALETTRDGTLWVGTSRGLGRWADGKLQYPLAKQVPGVGSLFADGEGGLWIGSRSLSRLKDGEVVPYRPPGPGFPGTIKCVCYAPDGTLWCGNNDGLFCVKDGKITRFQRAEGPAGIVSVLYRDRQGNLWVGAYGGLSRFVAGQFINEGGNETAFYRVFCVFEDREGNLWIGSEEGLTRLKPRYFMTYTREHGLTQNSIGSVCCDRQGGVWVGVWGGGANYLVDGKVTKVLSKTNGLATDFTLSVLPGKDGSLWVGNDYGFGVNCFKDGESVHYGRAEGYVYPVVTVMLEDTQGNVWLGSRDGLSCFRDGKFTNYTSKNGLAHNKINALCEGSKGVWVGTERGLALWTNGRFQDLSASDARLKATVLSLYEDIEGTLWIGTRDAGILRRCLGGVDAFTSREGLFSDCIYAILEDVNTNLWFNSSKGIFRISKRQFDEVSQKAAPSLTSVVYGRADGILSSSQYREVTQPAASKGPDGRLWFRSTQGLMVADPARIAANEVPPPVVIEEVISDTRSLTAATHQPGSPSVFNFPPGRGDLEIHYTALSFRAPEKVRFKYKLKNVDPDWVDAGSRRVAYYNNLRPGEYSFQVLACNEDGVWNNSGAAAELTFQPHFWQTWWFLGTGGLLSVGSLAGAVRYGTRRRMQRKLERLEQQHAIETERSRIARDLHDNLGTRLTEILMLNESSLQSGERQALPEKPQSRISHLVRDLADNLDAIVWATNPRNDSLDNFVMYVFEYLDGLAQASPVRILRDVPTGLPGCALSSTQRHNLFLVLKEALNNVFKHAKATEIQFRLRLENGLLSMSLEDNGSGFVPESTSELGNGLANMEKRMRLIGGHFALASVPGGGTRIRLEMPIKNGRQNGA